MTHVASNRKQACTAAASDERLACGEIEQTVRYFLESGNLRAVARSPRTKTTRNIFIYA